MYQLGCYGHKKTRKAFSCAGLCASLGVLKQKIGGGGGNRTRVRKPSTVSPTYLVR